METPSMDTIYQAISALYDNPNATEKEKASIWLGDVQKSIHSWKIADDLLQQKKDVHSFYFAAQTMRSKVQHNLSELPADALVSLRNSLIAHLESVSAETNGPILTQLCLALADLALQMPSWQNCVSDLIKSFSNKNNFALLEILTVLPQEIDSSVLKLGENRRASIKSELRLNAEIVTMFLKEIITSSLTTHIGLKIIKCMTSWIQVGAINIQEVPQNAVIGLCLQVLRDHNSINTLHDASADLICALLHCLEENNNNEDVERLLFDSVCALEESYHMAVAHEEEEKASNYARVFTELAESFLEKIINSALNGTSHFAMRSLELCLVCVGHHDYEVAEITFNLWYRLSEEVYQRDYQALTDVFKPYIERLIEALARHCQCEPDHTQLPDEGEDFYDFRMKVMELIKDVVFIVGSSSVFRQMFAALQANASWEQTEAALFVMQAVAKNILPDEYEYVPKVVEAILCMPEDTHVAVRKTCILLLGELCEWIENHPACVDTCLQMLLNALQHKDLVLAAATALQNICASCSGVCSGRAGVVLEAGRTCGLPSAAAVSLSRALAALLARLPADQLVPAMREAVQAQLSPLAPMLALPPPAPPLAPPLPPLAPRKPPAAGTDPAPFLDRLAALFRDVRPVRTTADTTHPCMPAFEDAWPVLREVLNKYSSESRIMERTCRAIRFALRCCGRHAASLSQPLSQTLSQLYSTHPHSCLLYLASVLVDELYTEANAVPHLINLLQELMPRAFHLLEQPNGLKDNPDTVDDLFRLCIRFLQRTPAEFLSCGACAGAVQCGVLAARLDHRDASASLCKFFQDLLRATGTARRHHATRDLAIGIINTYGASITYALLEAVVLHLHPYMVPEVAEVFVELMAFQRSSQQDWLRAALQGLPRGSQAQATDQQCWHFHQCMSRAEKNKEITRLLRDFARLYR